MAGKPQPTLFTDALTRGDFHSPLAIGDRLDTDIAGANAAQLPSLLVLTGVSSARDAVYAVSAQRPTFIANDLRALHSSPEKLRIGPQPGWRVQSGESHITITATGDHGDDDGLSVVRAAADAVWQADQRETTLVAGDDDAHAALDRWALLRLP